MANESIGTAPCPLCGKPARVTVSRAGLTVLTCNRCHCQLFARSDVSDGALRDRVTAPAKAAPVDPDPAPETPPAVPKEAPPEIVAPPPAAPAAGKKSTWDIWG